MDDEVNLHFVALVHVDGGLYELDGRKNTAVRHGDTTAESLLAGFGAGDQKVHRDERREREFQRHRAGARRIDVRLMRVFTL